jgi:hypothetical protein
VSRKAGAFDTTVRGIAAVGSLFFPVCAVGALIRIVQEAEWVGAEACLNAWMLFMWSGFLVVFVAVCACAWSAFVNRVPLPPD